MSADPHNHSGAHDQKMHPLAKMMFGWVTAPQTGNYIFWGLAIFGALLLSADLFIDRHPENDVERYVGFYGFYGFCAFSFVVLMGWPLGRLLHRDENYYGDQDDDGEGA